MKTSAPTTFVRWNQNPLTARGISYDPFDRAYKHDAFTALFDTPAWRRNEPRVVRNSPIQGFFADKIMLGMYDEFHHDGLWFRHLDGLNLDFSELERRYAATVNRLFTVPLELLAREKTARDSLAPTLYGNRRLNTMLPDWPDARLREPLHKMRVPKHAYIDFPFLTLHERDDMGIYYSDKPLGYSAGLHRAYARTLTGRSSSKDKPRRYDISNAVQLSYQYVLEAVLHAPQFPGITIPKPIVKTRLTHHLYGMLWSTTL